MAIALSLATAAAVIAACLISIPEPLLFRIHGDYLYGTYVSLLGVSVLLIVVSTIPWHHEPPADSLDYWMNQHLGRYFAMAGLGAIALGTAIVVGLANGIGGDVGYVQIGRHYFETYGGTPTMRISEARYLSSVRALGLMAALFFLGGCVICIGIGSSLHRAGNAEHPSFSNNVVKG